MSHDHSMFFIIMIIICLCSCNGTGFEKLFGTRKKIVFQQKVYGLERWPTKGPSTSIHKFPA